MDQKENKLLQIGIKVSEILDSNRDKAIDTVVANIDLLRDVHFILPSNGEDGIDYVGKFSELNLKDIEVNYFFSSNKLICLNYDFIMAGAVDFNHVLKIETTVSLDTQIQSYLYRKYKKDIKMVPANIDEILELIKNRKWSVDCLAYSMENVLFNEKMLNDQLYLDNMVALETYFFENENEAKDYAQQIINVEKNVFFGSMGNWYRRRYLFIYLMLLVMVDMQLNHSKWSLLKKEEQFLDFFHNNIFILSDREANLAKLFFLYGTKISFFGKIQKGRNDIIQSLKNMAWDIFHIQNVIGNISFQSDKIIDFSIPFFVTYDRRLKDILGIYKIRGAAFIKGTPFKWIRYVTDLIDPILKQKYFSVLYTQERQKKLVGTTEEELIEKLKTFIFEYEKMLTY